MKTYNIKGKDITAEMSTDDFKQENIHNTCI